MIEYLPGMYETLGLILITAISRYKINIQRIIFLDITNNIETRGPELEIKITIWQKVFLLENVFINWFFTVQYGDC